MIDTSGADADPHPRTATRWREPLRFGRFLILLVLAMLAVRSFAFTPFNIPSESMMPQLLVGDYLVVSKWNYGYSRYNLPLGIGPVDGRLFDALPARGDVVVFKAPPLNDTDYVKRVIGLPGDTVAMRGGAVILNGTPVPRMRIDDLIVARNDSQACINRLYQETDGRGGLRCRYPRYRETLPGGRSYDVLDLGVTAQDDTDPVTVPPGKLFLLGDNRDGSADSRFPAEPGQGIGLVDHANLIGRAAMLMFSTDGTARWDNPFSWVTAARAERVGQPL